MWVHFHVQPRSDWDTFSEILTTSLEPYTCEIDVICGGATLDGERDRAAAPLRDEDSRWA